MSELPQRLAGQVAVVTGAAAGIGAATARRLAGEGATVALADLDVEAARRVAEALAAGGPPASAHAVDVSDAGQVDAMIAEVADAHGRLDARRPAGDGPGPARRHREPLMTAGTARRLGLDPEEHRRQAAERTPLRRVGTPEDVAAVIAFLAGEDAAYVTAQTTRSTAEPGSSGGRPRAARARGAVAFTGTPECVEVVDACTSLDTWTTTRSAHWWRAWRVPTPPAVR